MELIKGLELAKYWYLSFLFALFMAFMTIYSEDDFFKMYSIWILFGVGVSTLIHYFGVQGFLKLVQIPQKRAYKYILLSIPVTFALGGLLTLLGKVFGGAKYAQNEGITQIGTFDTGTKIEFFLKSAITLAGEEFITAIILLPILILMLRKYSKQTALITAVIVSSLIFGALHLTAYDWNVYQSLIVIGFIRIPFDYLWFKSNTIVAGIISHILFDYIVFLPTALGWT